MVNICGKCKHFKKTETRQDGTFYHYCDKADELYGITLEPESAEPQPDTDVKEIPTLKIKFNDPICQYYEKKNK